MIDNKPDSLSAMRRVAIWGASRSGIDCLRQLNELGIELSFFIDKNPPESGFVNNVFVHRFDKLTEEPALLSDVDAVILAMGVDTSQPRKKLADLGFSKPVISFREGGSLKRLFKGQMCVNNMFSYDQSHDDLRLLTVLSEHIKNNTPCAIYGYGRLTKYLLENFPEINESVILIFDDYDDNYQSLNSISLNGLKSIFISSTRYLTIEKMSRNVRRYFGDEVDIIKVSDLSHLLTAGELPPKVWITPEYNIYPIEIPPIEFKNDLDFVLLDLPARFLGMMPNGLGYVHNILKRIDVNFQTMDLDLIFYHRYHSQRILDGLDVVKTESGYIMQREPWALDVVEEEWCKPEVVSYFQKDIDELIDELVRSNPKILGISLHNTNLPIAKFVVSKLRKLLPKLVVVVGGYDCIRADQGPLSFPDFDYMVVFEAENSLADLILKILSGEKPINLPGIISRYDNKESPFIPAPLVEDLDSLDFPRYDWTDINLYRNYHGYQLTPIVLSRGCRWSRCTFCAERFPWRRRSPTNMVDEIEWLAKQGCTLFHFNDSDLSGDPVAVRAVCEEVIRRKLTGISFVGQLRVQKGYTQDYFEVLKKAGFTNLRYGIDGWSKNTLKLHKKGYTLNMIEDVIRMTKTAGIRVAINLVIGIPYETEEDIDETIENIKRNRMYIDTLENINTLMLFAGSVYWEAPDQHGIRFRQDKAQLYKEYYRCIPTSEWYSVDPYIDQDVRMSRLQRIIDAVIDLDLPIGSYAIQTTNKLGAKGLGNAS